MKIVKTISEDQSSSEGMESRGAFPLDWFPQWAFCMKDTRA